MNAVWMAKDEFDPQQSFSKPVAFSITLITTSVRSTSQQGRLFSGGYAVVQAGSGRF